MLMPTLLKKSLMRTTVLFLAALSVSNTAFAQSSGAVEWRGFVNAIVAESNQIDKTADGINDLPNYTALSSIGMIASKQMNDQWDAAVQFVARGAEQDEYAAQVEWGMVTYRPFSELAVRVGKQKYPFWLISDQIDVGMLYPWIRPPVEVYDIMPITSFIGASIEYDFKNVFGGNLNFEVFGGGTREDLESNTFPVTIENASGHGFVSTYKNGISVVRAIYAQAYIREAFYQAQSAQTIAPGVSPTLSFPLRIPFGHIEVWSVGTGIDWKNLLFWYEFASRHTESEYYRLRQGEYATLGYYLWDRKILPHMTFARTVANKSSGMLGTAVADTGTQSSARFGLNYYIAQDVVLKGEVERTWVHGGKDTFSGRPPGYVTLYTAAVSAVF